MTELCNYQGVTDESVPILAIFNRIENVTTCTIVLYQDVPRWRVDASGVAVLNPKDAVDDQAYANRLAFKRAAQKLEDYQWYEWPDVRAKHLYHWYRKITRPKEEAK
jgi:hypothetical protein